MLRLPHAAPRQAPPHLLALVEVGDPRGDLLHLGVHGGADRLVDGVAQQQVVAVAGAVDEEDGRLGGAPEGPARAELGRDARGAPGVVLAVGCQQARRVGVQPAARLEVQPLRRVAPRAAVRVRALAREPQLALALVVGRVDEAREDGRDSRGGAAVGDCFTRSAVSFETEEMNSDHEVSGGMG